MIPRNDVLPGQPRSPTPAMAKDGVISSEEQDAIASQILASLADEDAWKSRFAEKRDVIHRMAREALEEDKRGETLPLDDLL